jgi:tetraacyldisaccharide 4'-kinase
VKIEYPRGGFAIRKQRSPLAGMLLWPAALIYRLASTMQRKRKGIGKGFAPPDCTVISVGNLEVGGGGKTPFCIYLLDVLTREGRRPVYASRGYRSESENLRDLVTVVLPQNAESCPPLESGVRYLARDTVELSDRIGDEGAMVAWRNPHVPLVITGDKVSAMRAASRLFRPSHIVLDDAFQSWGVYRDVDIVLLDAQKPFGNGRLLPAGTLREGMAALGRADGIGLNGMEAAGDMTRAAELSRIADFMSHTLDRQIPVFGIKREIRLLTARGDAAVADSGPAATLSSIARPGVFDQLLMRCGCDVRLSMRFPDHFRYRAEDIAQVRRLAHANNIRRLITTEKDWVKLRSREWDDIEITIARLELSVQPEDFLQKIKKPQVGLAASS